MSPLAIRLILIVFLGGLSRFRVAGENNYIIDTIVFSGVAGYVTECGRAALGVYGYHPTSNAVILFEKYMCIVTGIFYGIKFGPRFFR
jgi:hypothetical protein